MARETDIILPAGFTWDVSPDDKPSIGVFGSEGTGKTRFGLTMPGVIGVIALDKKCKRTCELYQASHPGKKIAINEKPFVPDSELARMVMLMDDRGNKDTNVTAQMNEADRESKVVYRRIVDKVFGAAVALCKNPAIDGVLVDNGTLLWQMILFKHYGRTEKIQPRDRGPANSDMIDFITMFRSKNFCITHWSKEVYTDDKPTGKFAPQGFRGIGSQLTAQIELVNVKSASEEATKFKARIHTCQVNPMLEGMDMGAMKPPVRGKNITWENVVEVMGLDD